jgi:hypothetical protein
MIAKAQGSVVQDFNVNRQAQHFLEPERVRDFIIRDIDLSGCAGGYINGHINIMKFVSTDK